MKRSHRKLWLGLALAAPVMMSQVGYAADAAPAPAAAAPAGAAPAAAPGARGARGAGNGLTADGRNSAIVPMAPRGTGRHDGFVERAKQGNVDLLFVGDSITDWWITPAPRGGGAGAPGGRGAGAGAPGGRGPGAGAPGAAAAGAPGGRGPGAGGPGGFGARGTRGAGPGAGAATTSGTTARGGRGGRGGGGARGGQKVWDEYYAKRNPFNIGIAGDTTQGVLWRLDNGEVDNIKPKAAVVMIGTNNSGRNSAEQIGEGVAAVVTKLHEKLPETKILLLAIFPRGGGDPNAANTKATREKLAKASEIASKVADGKMIHYMDIGPKFLQPDGTLPTDVFGDGLHPTEKGYRIWAEAIEPKLRELMGEPPLAAAKPAA